MKLFEYQSFRILEQLGIPLPLHCLIESKKEISQKIDEIALNEGVVKVQVLAGGRGKAGGIRIARSKEALKKEAESLIGWTLKNQQTGIKGLKNEKVLICSLEEIKQEYYLAFLHNLEKKRHCLLLSKSGGVDIEESQESIEEIPLAKDGSLRAFEKRKIARILDLKTGSEAISIIEKLARGFCEMDASLLEINPFIQKEDASFCALDAKIIFDENALYRQKERLSSIGAELNPDELSYIQLDGNIGCVVNGAGLAMATMDLLDYHGGKAANFLDVGGGASTEKIQKGLEILAHQTSVRVIFINIFGGIMDCSLVAQAIINAKDVLKEKNQALILRLEGTGVKKAREILQKCELDFAIMDDLKLAAKAAVEKAEDSHGNLD